MANSGEEGDRIAERMRLAQSMRDQEKYTEKVWKEIEEEQEEEK